MAKKNNKKKVVKKAKTNSSSKKSSPNNVGRRGIVPLNDRVLVRPYEPEELTTTASGIIIPDTVSKEKPEQGEVIAVGEGRWNEDGDTRIPLSVKVGDRVVFSKYGYDEIKYEGKEYYMLREESILAVIR